MKESVWQQFIAKTDKSKVIADLACQHAGRPTSRGFADGLTDDDTIDASFLTRVREFIGSTVYDAIINAASPTPNSS